MSILNLSDEELMTLYQEGSEVAFNEIYARHSSKVFGYLRKRCSSEQEASDMFQESFIKLHKSKQLYRRPLPLLPWIFSITHSVLIDGQRKRARSHEVLDFDFDQLAAPPGSEDHDPEPAASLIKKLPDKQQTAIQMRYINEDTFEDIAKHLKTSPMNVRQLISRGVQLLKAFAKEGDPS